MPTKVLLIDDDHDVTSLLAILLRRHGCDVRVVNDPRQAIDVAREFQPQGIALDIGMPDVDGYTLAKTLRQVHSLECCRIVAVSGYPSDSERLKAAGINAHFLKPVAAKVLAEALCKQAPATGG